MIETSGGWWGGVGVAFLWITGGVLLLAPLGLLWAPFAAGICGLIAHVRKQDRGAYAAAGAKSSALLLLPFFHVLARSLGASLPVVVVRGTFGVLYATWALWIVSEVFAFVSTVWKVTEPGDTFAGIGVVFMIMLFLLIVPVHVLLWIVSVWLLKTRRTSPEEVLTGPETLMPDSVYIWSIVWLFVGALMFSFYLIAGATIVHISTVSR